MILKRCFRLGVLGGVLVMLAGLVGGSAQAKLLYGFNTQQGLDLATDIVEVVPVKGEPGALRVVSVWRGTLEAGFVFDPSEIDLKVHSVQWDKRSFPMLDEPEQILKPTSYVLFLRDTEVVEDARLSKLPKGEQQAPLWVPANTRHVQTYGYAALYIEDGRAYGLAQAWGNPGPLVPVYHCTKASWRMRVTHYDALMGWLTQADKAGSADELAEVYAEVIEQGFYGLIKPVSAALKRTGTPAVEAIRHAVLHNHSSIGSRKQHADFRGARPSALQLIAEIDPQAAQPDLLLQVRYSKYHFDRVIASPSEPWSAGGDQPQHIAIYNGQEYDILRAGLQYLAPSSDPKVRELIESVREQWRGDKLANAEKKLHVKQGLAGLCDQWLKQPVAE